MKRNIVVILSVVSLVTVTGLLGIKDDFPELSGAYLGQKCPIEKAEVFLDGIVSRANEPEMCAAFSPGGKEFYFNKMHNGNWSIFSTKEKNGRWTKPEPLPFTSTYTDRDFTISPDGNRIYFGSSRPLTKGGQEQRNLNIFKTSRTKSGAWGEPESLGKAINTSNGGNYPCVTENGNLYFFSGGGSGYGGCELYLSRFIGGEYQRPENLGPMINSSQHDWDAYVAPDESYIIFSSQSRPDSLGRQDLYISFKDEKGNWTKSVNMGPKVNSTGDEICPGVSPNGKYLFFTSRRRGLADIFWIDAQVIKEMRPGA